jgi:hypothetical protein
MDYTDILKRAWNVTWRHKILWLFGLFAGAAGGFSGGSGGGRNMGFQTGTSSSSPITAAQLASVQRFLEQYGAVILLSVAVLFVIGLAFAIVGIAARGGLIHLVNEAEEGRPVRAGDGWNVGFAKWWRVFGVGFVAALPLIVVGVLWLGVFLAGVVAYRDGSLQSLGSGLAAVAIGGGCFLLLLTVVAIVFGVILGIVAQIALRYAVLQDVRVFDALGRGWRDLWARRGAFLMFLILVGVGIAYGIVVAVIAVVLMLPGVALLFLHSWFAGAGMIALAVVVLMVPGAIYATFYHAVWTIFFRRMTGTGPAPVAIPDYVAPAPYPPAPRVDPSFAPVPPEIPAPPVAPAPEIPAPPVPPVPLGPSDG